MGQFPDARQGGGGENLPGLEGVLPQEEGDLGGREIARRSDSALILKALPPVMGLASEWA